MNILNAFILFLIAVYIMQGAYKGFLVSCGNTLGMCASWVVSILFSPLLSQAISKGDFYMFLLNLTEGSSRLADQAQGNLVVSSLTAPQISSIVTNSVQNLPQPFLRLIEQNMDDLAFQQQGYSTINEYFNFTVANVVVNIFSFLLIYCLARVAISLIINAVNFASPLPVLRKFDWAAGAAVGALRGYLAMFALTMIVPVVLIAAPVGIDLISDFFSGSSFVTYFYEHNFLLDFISGTIPIS